MIITGGEKERLILPRWRSLARALSSGELAFPRAKGWAVTGRSESDELRRRLVKWRMQPSIISAAELVESSLVEGFEDRARNAARWLANEESHATKMVRDQALRLLSRAEGTSVVDVEPHNPRVRLRHWREITREYPEDPLAWVELALWQVTNGIEDRARKSMLVALQLAPTSRYVLRSAVRFFIHIDDLERGYDMLRKNPATAHDPWLLAGEIAVAGLVRRTPRYFKNATNILDADTHYPRQISELAGAVATVHLLTGRERKARKSFRQSLLDPTGNSLAQAEWASSNLQEDLVEARTLARLEDSSEAKTLSAYRKGDFAKVIDECMAWLDDEPYSVRPSLAASSAAITIGDYEKAESFAMRAYSLKPKNRSARNNLALALACLGKVQKAEEILGSPTDIDGSTATASVLTATRGLISLRKGEHERGISLYEKALKGFRLEGMKHHEALALCYYAREAQLAGLPIADEVLERATSAVRSNSAPNAKFILEDAKRLKLKTQDPRR